MKKNIYVVGLVGVSFAILTYVLAGKTFSFGVASVTTGGEEATTQASAVPVVPAVDTVSPTTPASFYGVSVSSSQINLSWTASTDDTGIAEYRIYRDGAYIISTTNLYYSDIGLSVGKIYNYSIAAVDAAGNVSSQYAYVSVVVQADKTTTPSVTTSSVTKDTEAPSDPTGLYAVVASSSQIDLSWFASKDNVGVIAYKIYRDGVGINSTSKTVYSDLGLSPGISYKYTVAAYDASGNLSSQSNSIILATAFDATSTPVPGPTTTPTVTPGSGTSTTPGPTTTTTTTTPVPATPATIKAPPAGFEDKIIVNPEAYKNPFPDTDFSSLEGKAAAELYRRAVLGGYPDGQFKGGNEVNRAEAAKFLLLTKFQTVEDLKNTGKFYDVLEGQWYVKFVVKAADLGIIQGYSDGNFRPQNTVTTAEFLKMLTKTFGLQENLDYTYTDVQSTDWFAAYAGVAQNYDLFPGKTMLDPNNNLTRNQVAVAIYQYLKTK